MESYLIIIIIYLVIINLIAFFTMGYDKAMAKKKKRRVPEARLFTLAAIGGSIGSLAGMSVFHHKTLHKSFTIGMPLILTAQLVITALFLYFLKIK